MADPARIEQILVNLLSNAAKYSTPGSEIRLGALARDTEIEIAVTNEGQGLASRGVSEVLHALLPEPCRRRPRLRNGSRPVHRQGSRRGIRRSNLVDSELGKYAAFAFTIPKAASHRDPVEGAHRHA